MVWHSKLSVQGVAEKVIISLWCLYLSDDFIIYKLFSGAVWSLLTLTIHAVRHCLIIGNGSKAVEKML